ncbi:MAG: hypothetical protein ACM3S1_02210 [Hyphomicrobiales bacterium]
MPDDPVPARDCLRCGVPLTYVGRREFHFGPRHGALGDFSELFVHRETLALFVCEQCGHVEFFHPRFAPDLPSDHPPERPPSRDPFAPRAEAADDTIAAHDD